MSPLGSDRPSYLLVRQGDGAYRQFMLEDTAQRYVDSDGTMDTRQYSNSYRQASPEMREALADMLMPMRPLEQDAIAGRRLVPAQDGQPYEQETMVIRLSRAQEWPAGSTEVDHSDWPKSLQEKQAALKWAEVEVPARLYRVALGEDVQLMQGIARKQAAGEISAAEAERQIDELRQRAQKIWVPEEYAQKLDVLREMRKSALLDPVAHPERAQEILQAQRDLVFSPYDRRLLPEHWGQLLEELPSPQLIGHLQLYDFFPYGVDESSTWADASGDTVRIFPGSGEPADTLRHEWSHLIDWPLEEAYRVAVMIDRNADFIFDENGRLVRWVGRKYAYRNEKEDFAVHTGEMAMEADPTLMATLAEKAPVRAMLIAEILRRELDVAQAKGDPGVFADELRARVAYMENEAQPLAKAVIDNMLTNEAGDYPDGQPAWQLMAQLLAGHFGKDAELARRLVEPARLEFNLKLLEGDDSQEGMTQRIRLMALIGRLDPAKAVDFDQLPLMDVLERALLTNSDDPETEAALLSLTEAGQMSASLESSLEPLRDELLSEEYRHLGDVMDRILGAGFKHYATHG
jgi:hypothetical protein